MKLTIKKNHIRLDVELSFYIPNTIIGGGSAITKVNYSSELLYSFNSLIDAISRRIYPAEYYSGMILEIAAFGLIQINKNLEMSTHGLTTVRLYLKSLFNRIPEDLIIKGVVSEEG